MKYRTIVADPPWRYDDGFATTHRGFGDVSGATRTWGNEALEHVALSVSG